MTEELKSTHRLTTSAIVRIVAIIAVIAALFAAVFLMAAKPSAKLDERVWNESATVGSLEARNYYIMYTDLMCPYCDIFSRAVMRNWDEFTAYLEENSVLFEVRLTDYLYYASESDYSRAAAEASYCAMREDKFWDYYHGAIDALWQDYHSKGIGDSKTSPMIKNLPDDYWLKIGHKAGLGEKFDQCVQNHETAAEVEANTMKALELAQGMPYFQFNRFTTSGLTANFGKEGSWEDVKAYLDAGLNKR